MIEIISLLVLTGTIIALLVMIVLDRRENKKTQDKLINALIAKTAQELVNQTVADNTKVQYGNNLDPQQPEYLETNTVSDSIFDKAIAKELEGEANDEPEDEQ